ncbi:2'-(5''-triphosphoribosyl)-3-dephospho-CoA synthase CitXG (plasmid) [Peptoclostridium acidaminophilum DSM 3953]|uniref:2'-(5''-triphosphoribosyl)-3-dephospho-CoA synthase CitXG n=1 Tax=Peptoclostridium acidaminophilum DSM 3953 TaxID=1286171 RepID=W8TPR0_PEPAC|nr:citrate lyase holo-[acyl-carrier protein] synthase [Peptoclostridium acidaminophilum]AHM58102.1 2'-(5''-triphosphoribosyl)-3-dephospho-CoA synthase CitXG [Peptoclostridium acidaminophilum DSM 3953]
MNFNAGSITLQQVLDARDHRHEIQQLLLSEFRRPVLSFTMNIAGEVKNSPLIKLAFDHGIQSITDLLGTPHKMEILRKPTGCEAFLVYGKSAEKIKQTCINIESKSPIGRLFDMDVIDADGQKLSRQEPRTCIVCGGPVAPCSRSRAHGLDAVKARTNQLLLQFAAKQFEGLAAEALVEEVRFTPKPGLVDLRNQGSHKDMDFAMFERSADSLRSYFSEAFLLGAEEKDCMKKLQKAGIAAESRMLETTGGVNTHKGAIYAFGLILAALGNYLMRGDDIFQHASRLARAAEVSDSKTHGREVFEKFGIRGAREEAEAGFPSAKKAYLLLKHSGGDMLSTLLQLISECPDTNLLYRGGLEGLVYAQNWAKFVLNRPAFSRPSLTKRMDQAFIRKNLSPGGCADLLALALFLRKVDSLWNENDCIQ